MGLREKKNAPGGGETTHGKRNLYMLSGGGAYTWSGLYGKNGIDEGDHA